MPQEVPRDVTRDAAELTLASEGLLQETRGEPRFDHAVHPPSSNRDMSDPRQAGGAGAGAGPGALAPAAGRIDQTLDMSPSPATSAPSTDPMPAAPNMRPATQMSPSAVPSTLESPTDKAGSPGGGDGTATEKSARPIFVDEIVGGVVVAESTIRDEQTRAEVLREAARREAAAVDSGGGHRGSPPTLMSPLVAPDAPAHADPSAPPPPPQPAVTFAQAPPHAYLPAPSGPIYPSGPSYAHGAGGFSHGAAQHGARPTGRSSNGIIIAIFAVGAALVVIAIAVSIGAIVVRSRQKAEAPPRAATATATAKPPRAPLERR